MASSMSIPAENSQFQHSSSISTRRRSLFPNEKDDSDSDLGHISPINYDSNSDTLSRANSPNDYHILDIVDNYPTSPVTPTTKITSATSDTMSPLFLSPLNNGIPSSSFYGKNKSFSPSQTQKTPHDSCTSATNYKMPKLIRKSLLDSHFNQDNNSGEKRKMLSPLTDDQISKQQKVEPNPKIRTVLFKDNPISTKTFYPKSSAPYMDRQIKSIVGKELPKIKNSHRRSMRRNGRNRKQFGNINAGVKHKIRRPKVKPINKEAILQAALNIIDNSPLNDYLNELKQLNSTEKTIIMSADNNKENIAPDANRKRERSPSPDLTKKFFKHSHPKATVTMNKNIKLEVDHGKISLPAKSKPEIVLDVSDLLADNESPQKPVDIENVLNILDKSDNTITLEAHTSVSASENSILLHAPTNKRTEDIKKPETMLSPTSQMCNMTSGLALNSPKQARNLTTVLESMPTPNPVKLYPIFENHTPKKENETKSVIRPIKSITKTWKKLPKDQMLLDAGQKRFGYTHCVECDTIYYMGDPGDELMHFNYHNALHIFKFPGWKVENVVETIPPDGRIIQTGISNKPRMKKIFELLDYINREFGYTTTEDQKIDAKIFLYIKRRIIIGFLMAQKQTTGFKMLSSENGNLCSEESYPIKCSVSHIWVSPNFRQKGVGTALMNAFKKNFQPGQHLSNADVAISSPTEAGKKFCEKYFQTVNYLVTM